MQITANTIQSNSDKCYRERVGGDKWAGEGFVLSFMGQQMSVMRQRY